MITRIFLYLIFSLLTINCFSQVDTINANNKKLNISNLKAGTNFYLVYFTDSVYQIRSTGTIWQRTTRYTIFNDKPVIEFVWKVYRNDSVISDVKNVCDRSTLSPIFHKSVSKFRGIVAYDFKGNQMIASDSIVNNNAQNKKITLDIPIINWEQDLETYPLLPIKKVGQIFDIAFFDPNEEKPVYHRYEVIGKEALPLNKDVKVLCWLLKHTFGNGSYAIFWLTDKSKEVVKMKEYYNGKYRLKIKLY